MTAEIETPLETEGETKNLDDIHPAAKPFLFLGDAKVKRNFIWIPLVGMITIEKYIPGSWAIYGFLAYSAIVLSANTLFNFLGRDEDYYGEGGLPDPDYSTDPQITGAVTGEPHHD